MMTGRIALAALAAAAALAALSAPWMAASHPMAALLVHSFFSRLCHQDAARSFIIDGSPVAVCVRCLGIYCGAAAGSVLALRLRLPVLLAQRIFWSALLLNVLDVAAEALHFHGNLPLPRFLLGASFGLASGLLLCSSPVSGWLRNRALRGENPG